MNPGNNTYNKTDQMNKTELIKEIKDYLINNFKNINIELTGDFEIKEEQLLIVLQLHLIKKIIIIKIRQQLILDNVKRN